MLSPATADIFNPDLTNPHSFSYQMFKDLQGSHFSISTGLLGHIETKLTDITDTSSTPQLEQFVTNFTLNKNARNKLEEGLYDVYNQKLGWFQLHLKPIDKQNKNECYQATFCLLT